MRSARETLLPPPPGSIRGAVQRSLCSGSMRSVSVKRSTAGLMVSVTTVSMPLPFLLRQLQPAQPERIGDDRDRREAHRCGGDHRIQEQSEERIEDAGRDRYAERVVDE